MGFAVGLLIVGVAIGWQCGRMYGINAMSYLARQQKERGDYWFDQYQQTIKERSHKQ